MPSPYEEAAEKTADAPKSMKQQHRRHKNVCHIDKIQFALANINQCDEKSTEQPAVKHAETGHHRGPVFQRPKAGGGSIADNETQQLQGFCANDRPHDAAQCREKDIFFRCVKSVGALAP